MASEIKVDTISEKTSANGVTIDGVSLKDSKIATANSVDSDAYVDGSIDAIHLSANSVDSDAYVDDSIDLAHMSSESVDEDNLHISNAGSNGQFLSKQSGNSGGLTWAAAGDMSDLTDDTSPQLGGDLDVNGQDIVSTSNADIDIIPNGTGNVNLGADAVQIPAIAIVPFHPFEFLGDDVLLLG